jgi:hypothetical protein
MGALTDFHPGTTKAFTIECQIEGESQDIRNDTVTITFKADRSLADSAAPLKENADVTTSGEQGIAIFTLTPTKTKALTEGQVYYVDIKWKRSTGEEYVIYDDRVKALMRVSDVPTS